MDAPAVKVRVAMDGSKEDFRLLSKAAEYIRRWQEKDPDRRFAFFTTCDTHEPEFNKGGYHFERFFKGDKARDLFKYELYMCSNIIADEDLFATHSFMQDYADENRERFLKEWKEQL